MPLRTNQQWEANQSVGKGERKGEREREWAEGRAGEVVSWRGRAEGRAGAHKVSEVQEGRREEVIGTKAGRGCGEKCQCRRDKNDGRE